MARGNKNKPQPQAQPTQSIWDRMDTYSEQEYQKNLQRSQANLYEKQSLSKKEQKEQVKRQHEINRERNIENNYAWNDAVRIAQQNTTAMAAQPTMQKATMPSMPVENAVLVGKATSIGRREYQQDALEISAPIANNFPPYPWLAILCDGMGGMNGGERASALCINQMLRAFSCKLPDMPIPDFFEKAVIELDDGVNRLTDDNGNYLGAGSTLISVIIDGHKLYWASVGDSHIYIIRGNEMVLANKEHNYLQDLLELVEEGKLTLEEAYSDPSKEALTSFMGIGDIELMDINRKPFKLLSGDYVVLCSDGLYRALSDNEIHSIILQNSNNMQQAANTLIACAIGKGNPHQDNTSVITIKYA